MDQRTRRTTDINPELHVHILFTCEAKQFAFSSQAWRDPSRGIPFSFPLPICTSFPGRADTRIVLAIVDRSTSQQGRLGSIPSVRPFSFLRKWPNFQIKVVCRKLVKIWISNFEFMCLKSVFSFFSPSSFQTLISYIYIYINLFFHSFSPHLSKL